MRRRRNNARTVRRLGLAAALAGLVLPVLCAAALAVTKTGSPGDDRLVGTPRPDQLSGRAGDDLLLGRGGVDRLSGGGGRDRAQAGKGRDELSGGPDADRLNGNAGGDRIKAGSGGDRLSGEAGRDSLIGAAGPDRLSGGPGRRPSDHSSSFHRGELADRGAQERLEALDPDAAMRRRDFVTRTAALAGAAGLATALPTERLIAEAARVGSTPLPAPRRMPIDTFVVLMMENRSFDHYFGWHPEADSRNKGLSYPDAMGNEVETYRLTPDFQGCSYVDPDHSWDGGRHQYGRGDMDGFVQGNKEGTGSDRFAAGFYLKDDIPFLPGAAEKYTLYDRWFCSIMASTYPNRHYQWGAQNGGQKSNELPPETEQQTGFTWETIADRAEKRGVSFTYYNSDLPFSALYGARGLSWTKPIEDFYVDAAAGTLPQICFVDPPFLNGGGGDGLSADEHPHGDIRLGQAFMSDVTNAFVTSRQYARGAMFIDYDEWGGFFDHVEPRFVPDGRQSGKLYENWGFTGFRTPGVVVSPFTRGGRVSHMTVTHESILKLISYRFGLGHLNKRHRYASNIGRSFDFRNPDTEPPELPDPETVAATPCSSQDGPARPADHDLVRLQTSGLLDRLGYDVPTPSLDRIFRNPGGVRRRLRESTIR